MKYLFSIALALGLAFAAYGAAATLIVNGGAIQSGDDVTLTCTDAAAVLGWGYETNDDLVHSVRFEVDEDCLLNSMFVRFTGVGDVTLFSAAQQVMLDECDGEALGKICVRLSASEGFVATDPELLTDIHVTIEGGSSD